MVKVIHSKYQGLNSHIGVSNSSRVSHSHLASFQVCADPRGGATGTRPPWGSKSFHFHAVFGNKLKNNSTFGSWRPPRGKSWIRHCFRYVPTNQQRCLPTNRGAFQPTECLPTNRGASQPKVPPNQQQCLPTNSSASQPPEVPPNQQSSAEL